MKKPSKPFCKNVGKIANFVAIGLLVSVVYLAFFSSGYFRMKYGDIGFDSVLFTLFSDLSGTANEIMHSYYSYTIAPTIVFSAMTLFLLFFKSSKSLFLNIGNRKNIKIKLYPFGKRVASVVAVVIAASLLINSSMCLGIPEYVAKMAGTTGTFYDEEYVDPEDVLLSFPDEKRNLIYIYIESMENTFFSEQDGGVLQENAMPELFELATDNINFSNTDGVGGCEQLNAATWTVAAMVSQTAGIPLIIPTSPNSYGEYAQFLPGVTSITDILNDNGYYQTLVLGSDADFGGRSNYFSQHGIDAIYDVKTARETGFIPSDYNVWWGMEDELLYEYAKQTLTELSERDEPFAFYTLTADTHHPDGYVCDLCEDEYDEQYINVYACASRQLADFIKWIQEQDFYENTTIVISGDHFSMDNEVMSRVITDENYERRIYNCFINSAIEPVNSKNRVFSQHDMFPSTLAAMGVTIPGEQLGLGVNLFSSKQTLSEKYGFDEFNDLQSANSKTYNNNEQVQ